MTTEMLEKAPDRYPTNVALSEAQVRRALATEFPNWIHETVARDTLSFEQFSLPVGNEPKHIDWQAERERDERVFVGYEGDIGRHEVVYVVESPVYISDMVRLAELNRKLEA